MSAVPPFRLLSTPFRFPDQRAPFARAHLYFDRLELETGLFRRSRRVIPLREVQSLAWTPLEGGEAELVVKCRDDAALTVRLPEGQFWQTLLESRLSWHARPERPPLPRRPLSLRDAALFGATDG